MAEARSDYHAMSKGRLAALERIMDEEVPIDYLSTARELAAEVERLKQRERELQVLVALSNDFLPWIEAGEALGKLPEEVYAIWRVACQEGREIVAMAKFAAPRKLG